MVSSRRLPLFCLLHVVLILLLASGSFGIGNLRASDMMDYNKGNPIQQQSVTAAAATTATQIATTQQTAQTTAAEATQATQQGNLRASDMMDYNKGDSIQQQSVTTTTTTTAKQIATAPAQQTTAAQKTPQTTTTTQATPQETVTVETQATKTETQPSPKSAPLTAYNWLNEYIDWHNDWRKILREHQHQDWAGNPLKFLYVKRGRGGLADRLRYLPYFLWLARRSGRMLIIDSWEETSCNIQEFLQPNLFDWTVPDILPKEFLTKAIKINKETKEDFLNHYISLDEIVMLNDYRVLEMYPNHLTEKGLDQLFKEAGDGNRNVFPEIMKAMFKLSDPVQQMYDRTKDELNLKNRDYIGIHLRLRYPNIISGQNDLQDVNGFKTMTNDIEEQLLKHSENALQCTHTSYFHTHVGKKNHDPLPVYVASDTVRALELLKDTHPDEEILYLEGHKDRPHTIITQPSHSQEHQHQCSDFYPALVDLWMLSDAQCIGFGIGGYGELATMMSKFDCWTIHQFNNHITMKDLSYWKDPMTNEFPFCGVSEAEMK